MQALRAATAAVVIAIEPGFGPMDDEPVPQIPGIPVGRQVTIPASGAAQRFSGTARIERHDGAFTTMRPAQVRSAE